MSEQGSKREHTLGINLYPEKSENEWVEFDSMIDLKPSFGNRSWGVEDKNVREKIKDIVKELVS